MPAVLFVTGDMTLSYVASVFSPEGYTTTYVTYTNIFLAVRPGLGLAFVAFFVRAGDGSPECFGLVRKSAREDFRWGRRAVTTGGVLFAIAALAVVAAILLSGKKLPLPPPFLREVLTFEALVNQWDRTISEGFGAFVAAPVAEELIYRAILLPPLLSMTPRWVAITLNALVFAFLHAVPYGQGWFVPSPLLGGVLMSIAFCARSSIVPAVLVHSFANLFLAVSAVVYVNLPQYLPGVFYEV